MTEAPAPVGTALVRLALRFFRRDLRSPQFIVIGLAVLVAVASITAVGSFTSRVRLALDEQSHVMLAADLAVQSSEALPAALIAQASAAGLEHSQFLGMRTMLSAGENLQLAELKAVEAGYPLRGSLVVRDTEGGPDYSTKDIPQAGEAWVDARLPRLLGIKPGDRFTIGSATFRLGRILVLEPDRAGEFFTIAPRVMINRADVPTTGLIAPGSRVQYALLVAGQRDAVERFRKGISLDPHARMVSPSDARPEIRAALTHAEQFLSLAALTTTTLAGIAILLAARSYAAERVDTVALLRTFGANRTQILALVLGELLLLALSASAIGTTLGFSLQEVLAQVLRDWTATALPPPPLAGALRGFGSGVVAVAGFALAPLLALRHVPPARILRQDLAGPGVGQLGTAVYALGAIALLAPWDRGDWRLTGWAIVGFAGVLVMLTLAGFLMVTVLGALRAQAGIAWRAGLANLVRRRHQSVWQISALGLGIMALLLLGVLRTDLMVRWQQTLPASTPDQFLVNIQPDQADALQAFLHGKGLAAPTLYPMVRGRLLSIAGRKISPDDYEDPRAKRLVDREFNLSWGDELKSDNRIVAGKFWQPGATPAYSVEVELAKRLRIELGDSLRFSIADQAVEAKVTSLREVAWDSMRVNFFVLAPSGFLSTQPATFITSFKLPAGEPEMLRELVAKFPNVTVIDVGALLTQVRQIMARVVDAVQFVFLFTLCAGVVVLVAALQATQGERLYDAVLMKTLGAPRRLIATAVGVEFAALGLCAGLTGGLGAWAAGWLIARKVLHIAYEFQPLLVASGVLAGLVAIVVVGVYAVNRALNEPVTSALRKL